VSSLPHYKLIEGGLGRVITRIAFVEQYYSLYRLFHFTLRLRPGKCWL